MARKSRLPGRSFDEFDICDPVAFSSCKAALRAFAIEACGRTAKKRRIDAFECIDTDHGVETVVDSAGDEGHYAAPGADVEFCSSSAECVSGYQGRLLDDYVQNAGWIGSPYAAVLDAKRAVASTSRNFCGLRFPREGEGDVPAMALTADEHEWDLCYAASNILLWCAPVLKR